MEKLNHSHLNQIKQAFIPGDPSQGGAPGGAPGGDPNAQGAAPGGDPNAQGAAPAPMAPSGMDPAMAGMVGGGMPTDPNAPKQSGMMTISIDDLIKLVKVFNKTGTGEGGAAPAAAPAQPQAPSGDPRIDHIIELLHAQMGGGQ